MFLYIKKNGDAILCLYKIEYFLYFPSLIIGSNFNNYFLYCSGIKSVLFHRDDLRKIIIRESSRWNRKIKIAKLNNCNPGSWPLPPYPATVSYSYFNFAIKWRRFLIYSVKLICLLTWKFASRSRPQQERSYIKSTFFSLYKVYISLSLKLHWIVDDVQQRPE